jgi:hypothetical protein
MQACQVCGTAEVDAGGYCTGCRHYRGPQSYALSPPAADLPAPQYDPGAVYYSSAGYAQQAAVAAYPVSPPAPQFAPAADPQPAATPQARAPLTASLFMVTVMVVVLVAGTVAVVLIRSKSGSSQPGANTGNNSAAPAAAAGAPSGPPPSTAPSTSTGVDRCVVGEWGVTSWSVQTKNVTLATDAGGIMRLTADGTGTWDFGSGVTLTGTVEDLKSEDLVTGRVDFSFRTTGQSFSFQDVRSDVREVLSQSGEDPVNRQISFDLGVAEYTCAGNALRLKYGGYDIQAGRK